MNIIRLSAKTAIVAGMYFSLASADLFGQANVGSIFGRVTDKSGP